MTKRSMWVATCLMFALFWVVVSLFLWFLIFPVLMIPISLLSILAPVGVVDNPYPRHNPYNWGDR